MKRGRVTVCLMTCCACISILYTCGVYIGRSTTSNMISEKSVQSPHFEDRQEYMHIATLSLPNQMPADVSSIKAFASSSFSLTVGSYSASTAQPTGQETNMNSVVVVFDPHGADVMVYLHIQKTGGSYFLEHLVTAQIPFHGYSQSKKLPFPASVAGSKRRDGWRTSWIPLCKTSPTGGWKRDVSYLGNGSTVNINHEICPRNWKHPKAETWLVSEKTTAWNCGVHAFYVDFKRCLSNPTIFNLKAKRKYGWDGRVALLSKQNRFHYVVLLRHPLLRYISEYLHASRGACWKRSFVCNGKVVRKRNPPPFGCPEHFKCDRKRVERSLTNLTLESFAKCQDSWSVNRMTVSLADHEEATCWNKTRYTRKERDQLLLASVKSNILNFSYFGMNEFPLDSGALFEKTFGVVLRNPMQNLASPIESKAGQFLKSLKANKHLCKQVIDNNRLDMELYEYALNIFNSRMRTIGRQLDPHTLNYIHSLNDIMHSM